MLGTLTKEKGEVMPITTARRILCIGAARHAYADGVSESQALADYDEAVEVCNEADRDHLKEAITELAERLGISAKELATQVANEF